MQPLDWHTTPSKTRISMFDEGANQTCGGNCKRAGSGILGNAKAVWGPAWFTETKDTVHDPIREQPGGSYLLQFHDSQPLPDASSIFQPGTLAILSATGSALFVLVILSPVFAGAAL